MGGESVDKRQTLAYILSMKYLSWNSEKNELLKNERGISFEEIVYQIESGNLLGIEKGTAERDNCRLRSSVTVKAAGFPPARE